MSYTDEFNELVAGLTDKPKRRANPETVLQKEIVDALVRHGLWVVRIPVQGVLQKIGPDRAVMKASPMAGFPDLLVIGPEGSTAWLEVKTPTGRATPLQKGRIERLGKLGHVASIVRSVKQALAVLAENGFIERDESPLAGSPS